MTEQEIKKFDDMWVKKIKNKLLNKKIVDIRIMDKEELKANAWDFRAIVITLDDGEMVYPSMDDEGNGAGAIFTTYEDLPTIPVMR
jgi:lauroyl/myristoyl acyltransferase